MIFIFILAFSLSQYFSVKEVGVGTPISYNYSKVDSLVLLGLLAGSIFFTVFPINMTIFLSYAFVMSVACVVIAVKKSKVVKQYVEDVELVYKILQKLVDKKNAGLSFDELPFEIEHKNNKIKKIIAQIDPASFNEKIIVGIIPQLNNFLNHSVWMYEPQLASRQIVFRGVDKMPDFAPRPDSHLQHARYMPLGLTGEGEVGWYITPVSKSLLHDKDKLVALPAAPHALVAGATGGGKAIYTQQKIE